MREDLDKHASPVATRNVCLFLKVNQLINVGHNTSLIDHKSLFGEGGVGFLTYFESFIYCPYKRRLTIELSVRAQLAGLIVVPIPGHTLEVGSNNPDKVGVTIPGALVMVKIIINRLVPSLVRGVGFDGTIVCVRLGHLELLLLLTPLDIAKIRHTQKAFPLPQSCLPVVS